MAPATPPNSHVEQRLHSEPILWLSSVRPDGRPHLVPVWFLWDAGRILMFSKPDNQKVRNIRTNPNVTVALEALDEGEDIVVIEGTATLLEDSGLASTLPAFATKYAKLFKRIGSSPEQMATEYTQVIEIVPRRFLAWGG